MQKIKISIVGKKYTKFLKRFQRIQTLMRNVSTSVSEVFKTRENNLYFPKNVLSGIYSIRRGSKKKKKKGKKNTIFFSLPVAN